MRRILLMLFVFIVVIMAGCDSTNTRNVQEKTILQINNAEVTKLESIQINFLEILKTNKDGKDYLALYPNTRVVNFTKIYPQEFEFLRNATKYKELYNNLPEKELYKVDFQGKTNLILTTIIDLEEQKIINIFGVYVIGIG